MKMLKTHPDLVEKEKELLRIIRSSSGDNHEDAMVEKIVEVHLMQKTQEEQIHIMTKAQEEQISKMNKILEEEHKYEHSIQKTQEEQINTVIKTQEEQMSRMNRILEKEHEYEMNVLHFQIGGLALICMTVCVAVLYKLKSY